jgi:predicted AlkP superfamily pyrophosphatase or phosphodiesterase
MKQGRRAAVSFWVGSEAEIGGVRPTHWRPFNATLPFEVRLEEFVGWLDKPLDERPDFFAIYIEETNGVGHRFGPKSPELIETIKLVDARVGAILQQCREHGLQPNIVVVSDHGMTAVDPMRVSVLEDYLDPKIVQIETEGSVVGLRPLNGDVDTLYRQVDRIPHATAYRLKDLPARLHMTDSPRLSPIWILPDEGAHVARRVTIDRLRQRYPQHGYLPADHGYDPAFSSMHGLFVAHGPAFRQGVTLPAVENVHVYNLLCTLMGVEAAPNSGDDRLARAILRD